MSNKGRNLTLDMLKGIACIFVVIVNFAFPGELGTWLTRLSSFAVPCFFMISGYCSYGKNADDMKRRVNKAFLLLIFAYILHAFFWGAQEYKYGDLHLWLANNFRKKAILKYALFCATDFSTPLWCMIAYFETCIFWYFTVRFKKENVIERLLPFLFVCQIVLSTTCTTLGLDWYYKVNFITFALVWFVTGYHIRGISREKLERVNRKLLVLIALAGLAIIVISTLLDLRLKLSGIGEIPYSIAIFLLAITRSEEKAFMPLARLGEKMAVWVYILHPIVGRVIEFAAEVSDKSFYKSVWFSWLFPLVVIVLSIALAWIFDGILIAIKKWLQINDDNTTKNKVAALVAGSIVFTGYIALTVMTRKVTEWTNPVILLGVVVIILLLLLRKPFLSELENCEHRGEKTDNRIYELDLLKVIACVMVVGVHTLPRGVTGNCLLVVLRYAVPIFFAISGFLYAKMNKEKRLDYIEKLFGILVVSSIVCLFLTNKKLYSKMDAEKLFRILFITGVRRHLWYLVALLEALTVKTILEKVVRVKHIARYVYFTTAFVMICLYYYKTLKYGFDDNYSFILDNFLVAGAMIEIGAMVRDIDANKLRTKGLAISSAVTYVLVGIGIVVYKGFEPQNASLLLYVSAGCVLLYFVNRKKMAASKFLRMLSEASLYVYVLHPMLPGRIAKIIGIKSQGVPSFVCTLIASFLISILCVAVKKSHIDLLYKKTKTNK